MVSKLQIFLIHTRQNEKEADTIYQRLSESGFNPWMGKKKIVPGQRRKDKIIDALEKSQIFLVILSTKSFEQNGLLKKDIQDLINLLKEKLENDNIFLIPVRTEDCEIPESLEDVQEVDLFEADGWTQLVTAIHERQAEVSKQPDASSSQAGEGNQRSYTRIDRLDNKQGFVITGGTVDLKVDQRKSRGVNKDRSDTVANPINHSPASSLESQLTPQRTQPSEPSSENQSTAGKLVLFKLGNGDFETGFAVTLQIGAEGATPFAEIQCKLPPAPNLPCYYNCWQSSYRDGYLKIGLRTRLEASEAQVTNVSLTELVRECHKSGEVLRNSLNTWLNDAQFRVCKEACLKKLNSSETIRVIIQAEDARLRRLPWHLWDFFEHYHKAEIALSTLEFERADKNTLATRTRVRILAILGDRTGIDIQKDRALLEHIPDAECVFLVEPNRREIDSCLWDEQGWDILFFAGHSSSHSTAETGQIYLNQTDSLTMGELRYALRKAIEGGLKLAIFNSCDGLGIARELAGLHIPQIIAMREPVPDLVAQEFLKNFLTAFSSGKSFYLAVREARERLQGLERDFPCATWLPVICQNPAEVPPTWQELRG